MFTFTPTPGEKIITATAFTGTDCEPDTAIDMGFMNFEVWWTTFWHTPSSLETFDIFQILLIGTDTGAGLCEFMGPFTINLAKLPDNKAIA